MKYFVNEEKRKSSQSTVYFEFQKGHYNNKCWLPSSISISDDIWDENDLTELFSNALSNFNYYGITEVSRTEWDNIVKLSHDCAFKWNDIILEVTPWVKQCFRENEVFTILGM